jgi:recombination protein RecA
VAKKVITRGKSLAAALKNINDKRDLRIASLGELGLDVEAVTTGNIALDHISGVGGLPKGRIIELFGPPSSGKTTCALQAAARAQKAGDTILYLDYEYALDPSYCAALGLDINDPSFLIGQPDTFEQGMNALRELIDTGDIKFVIVDSVAAMALEKEMEIETGGSTFADKAKLMAQAMRQLTGPVANHDVVCVFINHVRDVIDSSPMGQKLAASGIKRRTTPGGEALKFHASVRVEFKPIGTVRGETVNTLTNEKEPSIEWTKVMATFVKNKVAPPMRHAEVRVRYGHGFSQAWSVFSILVGYGAIKKKAAGVYEIPTALRRDSDESSIRGEVNFLDALDSNLEWLEKLTDHAQSLLDEDNATEIATVESEDGISSEDLDKVLVGS